jgi:hypothetical protein
VRADDPIILSHCGSDVTTSTVSPLTVYTLQCTESMLPQRCCALLLVPDVTLKADRTEDLLRGVRPVLGHQRDGRSAHSCTEASNLEFNALIWMTPTRCCRGKPREASPRMLAVQ